MNRLEKIIIGTVQFGLDYGISNFDGKVPKNQAFKIIDHAVSSGVKYLDTASAYGNAEKIIGEYLKKNNSSELKIITKIKKDDKIISDVMLNKSLTNLGLKKVDTLLLHSYDDYMLSKKDIEKHLLPLKGEKFNKLGVSVYSNVEIKSIYKDDNIDLIQAPFNLLDNHNLRATVLTRAKQNNKIIHIRSLFLQGLFFMNYEQLPNKIKTLIPYLEKIQEIAKSEQLDIGSLALNYALSKEYIDGVIFGVNSLEQLKQNFDWITKGTNIKEAVYKEIDNIKVLEKELLLPTSWKN